MVVLTASLVDEQFWISTVSSSMSQQVTLEQFLDTLSATVYWGSVYKLLPVLLDAAGCLPVRKLRVNVDWSRHLEIGSSRYVKVRQPNFGRTLISDKLNFWGEPFSVSQQFLHHIQNNSCTTSIPNFELPALTGIISRSFKRQQVQSNVFDFHFINYIISFLLVSVLLKMYNSQSVYI